MTKSVPGKLFVSALVLTITAFAVAFGVFGNVQHAPLPRHAISAGIFAGAMLGIAINLIIIYGGRQNVFPRCTGKFERWFLSTWASGLVAGIAIVAYLAAIWSNAWVPHHLSNADETLIGYSVGSFFLTHVLVGFGLNALTEPKRPVLKVVPQTNRRAG